MKYFKKQSLFLFALIVAVSGYSQAPGVNVSNPYAVPTYECGGIYWKTAESGAGKIRYKERNGKSWKDGLDLVYDSRHGEYRGSIINLKLIQIIRLITSNSSKSIKF